MMGEAPRLQRTRSLGTVIKEKDEELALFFEMRKGERDSDDSLLLDSPIELDPLPGSKPGSSPIFKIVSSVPSKKAVVTDDFLNSDSGKNDYDWLLTPPGTPLFPSLEKESKPTSHISAPKGRAALLKSRLSDLPDDFSKGNPPSKRPQPSGPNASTMATRRPLSSGGPASVSTKPSGVPSLTSSRSSGSSGSISSKPPSSRPAAPTSQSVVPITTKSSTSSTSTTRSSLPVKSNGRRSGTRPSTPTSRSSLAPPSKSSSRGPTPPRRSNAPTTLRTSGPSTQLLAKPNGSAPKGPIAARSRSPAAKALPPNPNPSGVLGVSNGVMSISTSTTLPGRPASASRGRSGPPSSRSLSAEPISGCKMRRKSCSPSRGRAPNGSSSTHGGSSIPAIIRTHVDSDDVNPVLMGTMMVERVINARRLMPPKQDGLRSSHGNASGKTGYPDSSGFGRMLSKKSLDMALRHMDIRKYPK